MSNGYIFEIKTRKLHGQGRHQEFANDDEKKGSGTEVPQRSADGEHLVGSGAKHVQKHNEKYKTYQ